MSVRFWCFCALVVLLSACSPSRWSGKGGIYHKVQSGQTLYSIAKTYQVDVRRLAALNGIADSNRLQVGQRLLIPGAERALPVPVTVPQGMAGTPADSTSAPAAGTKKKSETPAPGVAARPRPAPSPRPKTSQLPRGERQEADPKEKPEGGSFIWPVAGEVVRTFGRNGNQTCQGIEIAVPAGTPVTAAAAGRVTYSGNGIRGYGGLVIVAHDKDFFTVYGYNERCLVKTGEAVRKGQRIALSGMSAASGRPRLHFEIRRGKSPVNPIFYLP